MIVLLCVAAAGCSSAPGNSAHDDMGMGGNGGGGGDGGTPALAIAPLTASLGFGQSLAFTANRPVTWSVEETGGGVIDDHGHYTAPFSPTTAHVHAVTTDQPTEQAEDQSTGTAQPAEQSGEEPAEADKVAAQAGKQSADTTQTEQQRTGAASNQPGREPLTDWRARRSPATDRADWTEPPAPRRPPR